MPGDLSEDCPNDQFQFSALGSSNTSFTRKYLKISLHPFSENNTDSENLQLSEGFRQADAREANRAH